MLPNYLLLGDIVGDLERLIKVELELFHSYLLQEAFLNLKYFFFVLDSNVFVPYFLHLKTFFFNTILG